MHKTFLMWQTWLHGLGSAILGGGATALVSGVAVPNLMQDPHWLLIMGKIFTISGLVNAAFYLKGSPLPKLQEQLETEEFVKKTFSTDEKTSV